MKRNLVVYAFLLLTACSDKKLELTNGTWRGVIHLQEQQVPFNFEVTLEKGKQAVTLLNSNERLRLDSIVIKGDSVYIPMQLFDTEIHAKINGDQLNGFFIKNYAQDYKLPFNAVFDIKTRFSKTSNDTPLSAKYKIHFEDEPDSIYAVGILKRNGEKLTGTILTTTGDHRYLEGITTNDSLFLSAFDGEHVYLYKAKVEKNGNLKGVYYSGKSYNTSFTATPNDSIELPDANQLTFLKPGFKKLTFSFPGIDGKQINLEDAKYQNKVVIIQLLGSWCPNCMDETKFLAPWYDANKQKGVEIIGLAYEKKPEFEYAKSRIIKMKERLKVNYDIAIAGTSNKIEASKTLPMINSVLAFPTTIFIDKNGNVRKIHTGFSGPGTGKYYDKFVEEFNETINTLVRE